MVVMLLYNVGSVIVMRVLIENSGEVGSIRWLCEDRVNLTLKTKKKSNNRHTSQNTRALRVRESEIFWDISKKRVNLTLQPRFRVPIPP
jgi:hypothetical protein